MVIVVDPSAVRADEPDLTDESFAGRLGQAGTASELFRSGLEAHEDEPGVRMIQPPTNAAPAVGRRR